MSKQDRQGARTVQDLERKYNLGQGSSGPANQYNQLSQSFQQYVEDTNKQITEMKDRIANLTDKDTVLGGDVSALEEDVAKLKDEDSKLSDRIQAIEDDPARDGVTFTPSVSEDGTLSWTNDGGLDNPERVNIQGPQGEKGDPGDSTLIPVTVVTDSLRSSSLTADHSFAEIDEAISAGYAVYVKLLAESEGSAIYLNLTSHTAGSSVVFSSSYKNKPVVLEITA